MSPSILKLIHNMKPKHEKALQVKQPSCSSLRWVVFLGRLCHFLVAYPFPSFQYFESIPHPEARCSPALRLSLESAFWSWVTEVQDQDPHGNVSRGHKIWSQNRRDNGLLLRSSFARDITFCHLTMCMLLCFTQSVEAIFLLWLYFQAFDQMVTTFNNLVKCPSKMMSQIKEVSITCSVT